METPQVDGNQEDQEKSDKKIIGRGFRPALKTPKNFPYPIKLDDKRIGFALHFDEKRNNLYIGKIRYLKKHNKDGSIYSVERVNEAFVKLDLKGLKLTVYQQKNDQKLTECKKYIIPGEISLARTVDLLLADKYTRIKRIYEDPNIINKFTSKNPEMDFVFQDFTDIEDLNQDVEKQIESLALRHRKREIAGALLANNLWQKRGFVDKEKVAPKNFWQEVPVEELMLGDKRDLKRWWEDALSRTLMHLPGNEIYGLKDYKNFESESDMEMQELQENRGHLTKEEYSEKAKPYRMRGIIKRNAYIKPVRDKIKEGFLPEYPWEIRNWDKISFETLKKALLYGLHKMPEWEAYTKCGTPQIGYFFQYLQDEVERNIYEEKTSPNIKQKIEKHDENGFFQPLKQEIKEKVSQSLLLFTNGKISEGKNLISNMHLNKKNYTEKKIQEKMREKIKEKIEENGRKKIQEIKENIIVVFKYKQENQFIVPDFAPIDGWEWDKNGTSLLALETAKEEKTNYDIILNKFSDSEKYFYDKKFVETFIKNLEEDESNHIGPLKCIATKNENGIQKQVILGINPSDSNWHAIGYWNCDLTDLRKVKVFCRTLDAIKKELKPKINADTVTPNIKKEQVIENPLSLDPIRQSNKIEGRQ